MIRCISEKAISIDILDHLHDFWLAAQSYLLRHLTNFCNLNIMLIYARPMIILNLIKFG